MSVYRWILLSHLSCNICSIRWGNFASSGPGWVSDTRQHLWLSLPRFFCNRSALSPDPEMLLRSSRSSSSASISALLSGGRRSDAALPGVRSEVCFIVTFRPRAFFPGFLSLPFDWERLGFFLLLFFYFYVSMIKLRFWGPRFYAALSDALICDICFDRSYIFFPKYFDRSYECCWFCLKFWRLTYLSYSIL